MCRGSRANGERATDGMNPASNTSGPQQQHGDPGWVVAHEQQWDQQGVNAVNTGHSAGRPEWDWVENPMLLHVHNTSTNIQPSAAAGAAQEVDVEHKPHQLHSLPRLGLPPPPSSSVVCSNMNRSYALVNYSPGAPPPPHNAFPSSNHHMHNSLSSLSLRSYPAGPGHMDNQVYHQLYGTGSGAEVNMNAELRSYEQRRLLESHEQQQQSRVNVLELVKREEMFCPVEPQARIGLNLGGRTYFSAEDSAARVLGKRSRINALGTHAPMCQVQGCSADLTKAKHYHRRHKVCEIHSKAPNVIASGHTQRFCQQCSRFHQLSEFDDTKRSCRKRLADHNRRRRKPQHSAIAAISTLQPFKTEELQSTGSAINIMRPTTAMLVEEHKPGAMVQLQVEKSASPTASVTDRDSMMSCGGGNNRLQVQSPSYGTILDDKQPGRNALVRAQAVPSSDVQALVLSVVSRTPTPGPHSTRQSPGTQESVYHQYLHGGPSLSLSSAGMNAPPPHTQHNNNSSPSSQNYSSIEHSSSLPWLPSCSRSRSSSTQLVSLQQQPRAPSALQTYPHPARSRILATQVGHDHHDSQVHQPEQHHQYMVHTGGTGAGEQLGRLGLRQGTAMDGHRMLALIENPAHQQQLTSSVDDVKPLQHHHSEMQSSTGVRSSFGSSFYDSSSSIG